MAINSTENNYRVNHSAKVMRTLPFRVEPSGEVVDRGNGQVIGRIEAVEVRLPGREPIQQFVTDSPRHGGADRWATVTDAARALWANYVGSIAHASGRV